MEMEKILTSILKKNKCSVCGFYLSVPPITISMDDEEIYKCGRCKDIVIKKINRYQLFEDVTQHISFPCSYSDCKEIIPWGQVQQHENNCVHKTIKCPMFKEDCEDIVYINQLLTHFEDKHKNFIVRNNSVVIVDNYCPNSQNTVYIIEENNHIFIVYILTYGEIAVFSTTAGNRYTKFDLKMFLPINDTFSVNLSDLSISIFEERLHCIRCMLGKCNTIHHVFSTTNSNRNSCVKNLIQLRSSLFHGFGSIVGNIRYSIFIKADESDEEIRRMQENKNNEALKKALTCPYCLQYFTDSIFTCITGHILCEGCKIKLKKCPTCQSNSPLIRCFTLETLARDAELSCENELQGCAFKGNTQQITDHENNCIEK